MASYNPNTIAWLVPTMPSSPADQATLHAANAHLVTSTTATTADAQLVANLPNLLSSSKPQRALQLSFDTQTKRPGRFVLGCDASACDIVLPALHGVGRQHCSIRFDAQARLVLDDFSDAGTQVWYDWDSNGDRCDYSWLLSSGCDHGFPSSSVRRITIDVQGVRFQIVINDHSTDWDAYRASVDSFSQEPSWLRCGLGLPLPGWDRASVVPVMPLFSAVPLFQHIFVKSLAASTEPVPGADMYLWNLARPWEPMVKAA